MSEVVSVVEIESVTSMSRARLQCSLALLFNLCQYYVGRAFRAASPKGMVRQPYIVTYDLIT